MGSCRGFNASICEGGRHCWVVVTINNMQVMIETAENSTCSFVCGDGFVVIFVQDGDPVIYPGIRVPLFRSHQSCTITSMRRLKIMDAIHKHHEHMTVPNT